MSTASALVLCAIFFACGFTLHLPAVWRLRERVAGLTAYTDQLHDDLDLATRDIASLLGRQEAMLRLPAGSRLPRLRSVR